MLFPEPYIDAALETLREELPAAIVVENSKHDDFLVPTPDESVGYFWGVETAIGRYPAIEVGVPDEQLDQFSLGQVAATSVVSIAVRAWLARDEEITTRERMARANYRMGRAVTNVLIVPGAFGGSAVVLRLRAQWRLNPETRESEEVLGSATLLFTLEDEEGPG